MNESANLAAAALRFSDARAARKWSDMYDSDTPVLREANYRARRDMTVDVVHKLLPTGGRVLDLGCGSAPVLSLLRKAGISCVGVDVSEDMVRRGRERLRSMGLDDGGLEHGDCCRTPYGDASFDIVVCLGVISYVENYEVVLNEINRLLKPGGHALVSFRNRFNPILWDPVRTAKLLIKAAVGSRRAEPYKVGRLMDFREFRARMARCGFEYRSFNGIGYGPVRLNGRPVLNEQVSIRFSNRVGEAFGRMGWALPKLWMSDVSFWVYQKEPAHE